jgi:phenylpropionate dioxygenase-like ring-hydroxylating dioxygenase large terminal subunit
LGRRIPGAKTERQEEEGMDRQEMLSPATYAGVREPVHRASTLPPHCYTSWEWYEQEVERVFLKEWIMVGRAEQIPNPGDYFRSDWVREPIIVVRDDRGAIRALSASCRHRGTEVASGKGHCNAFRCPYHGWTYSLRGDLLSAPGMDEVESFDKGRYGLIPVPTETWGGFIFVNFDVGAAPLMSRLGPLAERLKTYRFEDMRVTKQWSARLRTNWKIWLENSREGYHVQVVHRETYRRFYRGWTEPNWRMSGIPGVYEMMSGTNDDGLYLPRDPVFPMVEGLSREDLESTHFVIFYPLLLLNIPPSHLAFHQLLPEAPDITTVITWMCFPRSTVERPDFEEQAKTYYEIPEMFIPEDRAISETMQRGLTARLSRAGRFALEEKPCHAFANYLLDRIVGPARRGEEV